MVDTANNNEAAADTLLNPYLFKLEFKPKPVLSHELGAGSLCLKCKCPGLDLHFWRKMCKNCYCRLDEHDIILPDDQDHGEIVIRKLFGANAKESAATYRQDPPIQQVKQHQQPSSKFNKENPGYEGISQKLHQININKQQNGGGGQHKHNSSFQPEYSFSSQALSEQNGKHLTNPKVQIATSAMYTHTSGPATATKLNQESPSRNHTNGHFSGGLPQSVLLLREYTWMPAGDQQVVDKRQRLAFQLPYHDCDVEATNSLKNDAERQAHKSFVDFVKQNVVGIGEIVDYTKHHQQHTARTIGVQTSGNGCSDHQQEACKNCEKDWALLMSA
uniref:PET domain-containing protein n=1 Tax=Ditylenchus dipsaci TaxID=166011 RepID=A0A915DL63_9BILA